MRKTHSNSRLPRSTTRDDRNRTHGAATLPPLRYRTSAGSLARVVEVVRQEVLRDYLADTCILTARCLHDVLEVLGYVCEPMATGVVLFNPALTKTLLSEKEIDFSQQTRIDTLLQAPGCHSVGIGISNRKEVNRYNGHLTLLMHHGEKVYLIDGSLDQADRPHHGMAFSPFIGEIPSEKMPFTGDPLPFMQGNCLALYYPRPEDREWESTPDWQLFSRHFPITQRALEILQKGDCVQRPIP